jgi:hypothetical protein
MRRVPSLQRAVRVGAFRVFVVSTQPVVTIF